MIIGVKRSVDWRDCSRWLPYPKIRKHAAGTYSVGGFLLWFWRKE